MPIINRFMNLFTADIHAVLDRLEEPEILLRQAIREMEEETSRLQTEVELCRADIARDGIADFEAERRAELSGRERAAWDRAEADNSIAAYEDFLADYPDGAFAETAKTRIAELEEEARSEQLRAQFGATENAVARNSATRLLIEGRLEDCLAHERNIFQIHFSRTLSKDFLQNCSGLRALKSNQSFFVEQTNVHSKVLYLIDLLQVLHDDLFVGANDYESHFIV